MIHEILANKIKDLSENIVLIYAFNNTGKTRLSVSYKDISKSEDGNHTGVYYNAFSEDLFSWDNGDGNDDGETRFTIKKSNLNSFHTTLTEDNIREHLNRYKPSYGFDFNLHENTEEGIDYITFFKADDDDRQKIKVSRGEERIFVWSFFLALLDIEEFSSDQSNHIFIDDPVSSLDDHNIFITASTLFDLIENHYENRKIILTTHHIGLFSILSDWIKKGNKASKFRDVAKFFILSNKNGSPKLENFRKDVFLYHLRLLQILNNAKEKDDLRAFHLALLRQILENISSFLGTGRVSHVLEKIGIEDPNRVTDIINALSHKKVYYYETDDLVPDNENILIEVLEKLQAKYEFVLH